MSLVAVGYTRTQGFMVGFLTGLAEPLGGLFGAFAVALIYVSYAYTGWNAATYLSSELDNPQHYLPRILFAGTAVVTALYVALNAVFLKVAPMDAMAGQVEVGYVAAEYAFGDVGGRRRRCTGRPAGWSTTRRACSPT